MQESIGTSNNGRKSGTNDIEKGFAGIDAAEPQ